MLKIDGAGIKGESEVEGYKDYMIIKSFRWGATQKGYFHQDSGGGAGQVEVQDFSFTMRVSKASPKLFEACANGSQVKSATLICRRAGGKKPAPYLKVAMSDVLVSNYETGGEDEATDFLTEKVSLHFGKIQITYTDQKDDGSAGSNYDGEWDIRKMK